MLQVFRMYLHKRNNIAGGLQKPHTKRTKKWKSAMYQDVLYLSQNLMCELYEQDSAIVL